VVFQYVCKVKIAHDDITFSLVRGYDPGHKSSISSSCSWDCDVMSECLVVVVCSIFYSFPFLLNLWNLYAN